MRIGKTAMNKSSKQESNVLKATFEKEYGVSTEEVYKVASHGIDGLILDMPIKYPN